MRILDSITVFVCLLAVCHSSEAPVGAVMRPLGGVFLVFLMVILSFACVMCVKRKRKRDEDISTTLAELDHKKESDSHNNFSDNGYQGSSRNNTELQSTSNIHRGFTSASLRVPEDEGDGTTRGNKGIPYLHEVVTESINAKGKMSLETPVSAESIALSPENHNAITTTQGEVEQQMDKRKGVEIHPPRKTPKLVKPPISAGNNNANIERKFSVNARPDHSYDDVTFESSDPPATEHMYHSLEEPSKDEEYSTAQTHSLVLSTVDKGSVNNDNSKDHVYHILDGSSPNECGVIVPAKRATSLRKKVTTTTTTSTTSTAATTATTTYTATTTGVFDDPAYEFTVLRDHQDPVTSSSSGGRNLLHSNPRPRTQSMQPAIKKKSKKHHEYEETSDFPGVSDFKKNNNKEPLSTARLSQRRKPRCRDVYESTVVSDDLATDAPTVVFDDLATDAPTVVFDDPLYDTGVILPLPPN